MKKFRGMVLVAGILMLIFISSASARPKRTVTKMRINVGMVSAELNNKVKNILANYGGWLVGEIPQIKVLTFSIPKNLFLVIKDHLELDQLAEFVEEDYTRQITLKDIIDIGELSITDEQVSYGPNDPDYPNQWGPACIGAEDAWELELGSVDVIVAVVDTGVDLDHPDLVNNVDTGIDWDFVNNDDNAMDDQGHGTHVAGTIAAEINNRIGVAGLQQITIMAVKGLSAKGSGQDSVLAQCIIYAADNGAKVINCSWGSYVWGNTLKNATEYAFSQGAIIVAAAGNDGRSWRHYPSAYPKVVGVAALKDCTTRAWWSNRGLSNVQASAPGADILSTYWNNSYAIASGTSMASPHVAGVAAAYFSYDATLTNVQILRHMVKNADDLGAPGLDESYGYGRVDMYPF